MAQIIKTPVRTFDVRCSIFVTVCYSSPVLAATDRHESVSDDNSGGGDDHLRISRRSDHPLHWIGIRKDLTKRHQQSAWRNLWTVSPYDMCSININQHHNIDRLYNLRGWCRERFSHNHLEKVAEATLRAKTISEYFCQKKTHLRHAHFWGWSCVVYAR